MLMSKNRNYFLFITLKVARLYTSEMQTFFIVSEILANVVHFICWNHLIKEENAFSRYKLSKLFNKRRSLIGTDFESFCHRKHISPTASYSEPLGRLFCNSLVKTCKMHQTHQTLMKLLLNKKMGNL